MTFDAGVSIMKINFAACCLAASASMLVACGGGSAESDASTSSESRVEAPASLKVSVPPAPTQKGGEHVRFDPCVMVADELVTRAGFDPGTRERFAGETMSAPFTRIGCQFWRHALVDGEEYPTGVVSVTSSNATIDDVRKSSERSIFDESPIGGRPAVLYRTPKNESSCSASVESDDGTLIVTMIVHPGPVPVPPACDRIREVAEIMAESLDTR